MTRRIKAKPEALKARGKLADGTQPGTVRNPMAGRDSPAAELEQMLPIGCGHPCHPGTVLQVDRSEVRAAERDRALDLLARLERIVTKTGGYMAPEDQDALREARAMLVEHERLADQRKVWRDRG